MAIGHVGGISTMLVPGAGEPNFDSRVADPFQVKKARQEQEVHQLLEKLQPQMIVLDPTAIGQVRCILNHTSQSPRVAVGAITIQISLAAVDSVWAKGKAPWWWILFHWSILQVY